MATDKNFIVKNGLEVGGQEVISSSGVVTSAALGGQTLSSTDSPTFNDLTLTGDLNLSGELNITGDINSLSVTDLDVADKTITLGAGQVESASGGSGIIIDGSSASLLWNETNSQFDFNKGITVDGTSQFTIGSGEEVDFYRSANANLKITLGSANAEISSAAQINFKPEGTTVSKYQLYSDKFYINGPDVGIGTNSPSEKLTVAGPIGVSATGYTANATTANFGLYTSGSVDTTYIQMPASGQFQVWKPSTGAVVTVLESGNVGIGANSPDGKLHIKGGTATDDASHILFENTQGSKVFAIGGGSTGVTNNNLFFRNVTDNTTPMVITDAGNVGINQTNPSHRLQVAVDEDGAFIKRDLASNAANLSEFNTHRSLLLLNRNSGSYLAFGGNGSRTDIQATDLAGTPTAKNIALNPFGGNVGIGTNNPQSKLHIENSVTDGIILRTTANVEPYIALQRNSGNNGVAVLRSIDGGDLRIDTGATGAAQSTKMTIEAGGNVGIGDTNPQTALHVKSSFGSQVRIQETGGTYWDLSGGGRFDIEDSSGNVKISLAQSGNPLIAPITVNTSSEVGMGKVASGHRLDVNGSVNATDFSLEEISTSNSDTAVDVFVYDTRKDSDGGAWRKRTQHTSWYNEASGSNRSSRKEFPCVAVLAFNTNQELWIYDGDDPELPVWAKYTNFTQDSGAHASITAINGSIYCGQAASTSNYSGNGYFQLNFVADYFFSNIISVFSTHRQGRADGLLTSYNYKPRGDRTTPVYSLRGYQLTDLDITVLPNAPIDTETGLPIPTIAVGSEAGVSIIRDNGSVVDIINTQDSSAFNYIDNLFFRKDGALVWAADSASNTAAERFVQVLHDLPTADTNQGTVENSSVIDEQYGPSHKNGSELRWATTAGVKATSDAGENFAVGTSGALHLIKYNREVEQEGAIAHITSDYNTGYMLGDIKLAALADTDTTNATGTELITNGTTFSDTTGWSGNSATVSVSSGELLVTGTATQNQNQTASFTSSSGNTVGDQFIVSFEITEFVSNQSSAGIIMGGATIAANNNLGYWYPNSLGTHTTVVTATSTSVGLNLHAGISVGVATKFDNISMRKLTEEDRSYNNNNLAVYGTINKTAVATGAELVGYTPSSSNNSNYLCINETDWSIGAGDFSISFWWKGTSNGDTTQIYLGTPGTGGASPTGGFNIWTYGGLQKMYISGDYFDYADGGLNRWLLKTIVRRNGVVYLYENGILKEGEGGASTGSINDQKFNVFYGHYGQTNPAGSIALLRISATAPTEEQVKKMYNEEKHLFQTNAGATIAGTSDAVTALAYDEDTELLHVGSSWGRSVFQGLNRVEYSSDVVSTAISASNGLVVEE